MEEIGVGLASFAPLFIIQWVIAVVVGLVSKKIGLKTWVWVLLTLIPLFGILFVPWFVLYKVVAAVIDRLDQIKSKVDSVNRAPPD